MLTYTNFLKRKINFALCIMKGHTLSDDVYALNSKLLNDALQELQKVKKGEVDKNHRFYKIYSANR